MGIEYLMRGDDGMNKNPWQWAAMALMALGILSAFLLINNRISTENQAKVAEIALDYTEIQKLADQSEENVDWWLAEFRKMGALSAAVGEESLSSLREEGRNLDYGLLYNIRKNLDWRNSYPQELIRKVESREYKDHHLFVRIQDPFARQLVSKGLKARYPDSLYDAYITADTDYYVIKNRPEDVYYNQVTKLIDRDSNPDKEVSEPATSLADSMGLGFDPAKIESVKGAGLEVIPRSINYNVFPEKLVGAYKNDLKELGITPRVVLFIGKEVTGYPSHQTELTAYMKENNIAMGLIETPVQRGAIEQADSVKLTRDLDYHAVRAFSVMPYIQKRYKFYNYEGAEEIENTMYRAITERNIRLIYFKPFKYNDLRYVTNVTEYQKTFENLKNRLEPHQITLGEFSQMPKNSPSKYLQVLLASGLWAALLLLLNQMWAIRPVYKWTLLVLGFAGSVVLFRFAPALGGEMTAFGSSVFFPSLAGLYLVRSMKSLYVSDTPQSFSATLLQGVSVLAVTTALSLAGGLIVGGALSGSEYLLEMEIFRGVKASQLVPLVVMTGIYLYSFGYRRSRAEIKTHLHFAGDLKAILFEEIKIYYLVLAGIVGAIGYVYIARTGHETNITPSDLEMISRNFLEYVLLARPRTKEFLLAFPIIVSGFVFARFHLKKLIYPAALGGMIGLTSVANTFSHLRTPIYLSVVRTGYSIAFGAALGVIAFSVLWMIVSVLQKRIRSIVE